MLQTHHGDTVFRSQRLFWHLSWTCLSACHAPLMCHHMPHLMRHHALFPIAAWSPPSLLLSHSTAQSGLDCVWNRLVLSGLCPDRPRLTP